MRRWVLMMSLWSWSVGLSEAATICYYTQAQSLEIEAGAIWGVHPDHNFQVAGIHLPANVACVDVPEPVQAIPWPSLGPGLPGSEHTTKVNVTTQTLEVRTDVQTMQATKQQKKNALKQKLNLSDQDIADLRELILTP